MRPGGGTLAKEKPPIFGMIERGGEVRIVMLENVQQPIVFGIAIAINFGISVQDKNLNLMNLLLNCERH